MKTTSLEKIIYFQDYVVVDAPGDTPLKERQLLTEDDYRKARESYGDTFEADMGAEAIKKLLEGSTSSNWPRELRQNSTTRTRKTSRPSRSSAT